MSAADPNHPSRKHDVTRPEIMVTPSSEVPTGYAGQPRRRDRRALARHQLRHYEVSGSVGGGDYASECACGSYFTAPTSDLLREVTAVHYERAA